MKYGEALDNLFKDVRMNVTIGQYGQQQNILKIYMSDGFINYIKLFARVEKDCPDEGNKFFGIPVEVGTLFSENHYELILKSKQGFGHDS